MSITDKHILDVLCQALPDPVILSDKAGTILFVNMAAADVFGYAATSLPGRPLGLLLATGERHADGSIYRHADGTIFSATTRIVDGPAGDRGADLSVRILILDGSARKRNGVTGLKDIALERQRLDYATLVESIPDFITRISPDLTYTFVNAHFAAFIGRPPPDIIGRKVLDFIPDGDPLEEILIGLTPEVPDVSREQRRVRENGEDIWILWTNVAVFDAGRLIEYVTVGRDVTEIKRQQLRIAGQSAELQRRNAALGRFTGTVSHDLKAPMRHIAMFAEMIANDVAAERFDEVAACAQQLRKSSRRMTQLVDSLLDYAKIADRIATRDRVAMRAVVDDALLNLQSDIDDSGAGITIGVLPDVLGDAELLKRLFQNVIGNAIKYRRPGVLPVVSIEGRREGDKARFSCTDNGIGIEPHLAETIFDVFQRLHRDETVYPGTGVGLSLARRIADSHQGTIALDPTHGAGARFIVTLPAA